MNRPNTTCADHREWYMNNHNYKIGGRVKISGKWYDIVSVNGDDVSLGGLGTMPYKAIDKNNKAYEPPKQELKPFDWVPFHYNLLQARDGMTHLESINAWLTENYGDPTERVYNGEDASEFGLEDESRILCLFEYNNNWADMSYRFLAKGDIWRKMPPLKTKKGNNA
jgi:hypothetical protein